MLLDIELPYVDRVTIVLFGIVLALVVAAALLIWLEECWVTRHLSTPVPAPAEVECETCHGLGYNDALLLGYGVHTDRRCTDCNGEGVIELEVGA